MDKRKQANQRVKDRLLAALVEFAEHKDWSKVTVTALVEKAGVARASFYRNFTSVEELIEYGIRRMAEEYHAGKPSQEEGFRNEELVLYKFRFYREHADLILSFHRAKATDSLLEIITDCEIQAWGDMPMNSPARYEVYFYSGAFYSMLLNWLESGTRESAETMAREFMRMVNGAR